MKKDRTDNPIGERAYAKKILQKAYKENSRKAIKNTLDKYISKIVRDRDEWRCVRCGKRHDPPTNALHCSHYFSRRFFGTRWDLDNLDALCYGCHLYVEGDKQGWYHDYMIKKLGQEKYDLLEFRARSITKYTAQDLEMMYEDFKRRYH